MKKIIKLQNVCVERRGREVGDGWFTYVEFNIFWLYDDLVLQCRYTEYNKKLHTITVTSSYSNSQKNFAYGSRASCVHKLRC